MKKLTNTEKVLRYVRSNPKAKAKEVAIATGVKVTSVYQIIHKSKKDQALTMSASPAVLLKYPPKREKLRMASQYLMDPTGLGIDKGLLLIEQLLWNGDIAFQFPQEWLQQQLPQEVVIA